MQRGGVRLRPASSGRLPPCLDPAPLEEKGSLNSAHLTAADSWVLCPCTWDLRRVAGPCPHVTSGPFRNCCAKPVTISDTGEKVGGTLWGQPGTEPTPPLASGLWQLSRRCAVAVARWEAACNRPGSGGQEGSSSSDLNIENNFVLLLSPFNP